MIHQRMTLEGSQITFGTNSFAEAFEAIELDGYSSLFIISQQNIWDLHGERVFASIIHHIPEHHIRMVEDGESVKNLSVYGELLHWLAELGADRKSLILVLGGGVVGDLSGFVAASYMRGMSWVYVPTTLLSQQDASIGGKTAVNLPHGKNLVGAFWSPKAVIIDTEVLDTLPDRQIQAGYMELLKHGMLAGEALYQKVSAMPLLPKWASVVDVLCDGLAVKVGIVGRDPFEKNERRLLNLGHTFGHALESFTQYKTFLHGEAVGLGLIYVSLVAKHLGGEYDWTSLKDTVLPRIPKTSLTAEHIQPLLDLTQLDKKGVKGVVSWIIPFAPGRVEIVKGVSRAVLEKAAADFFDVVG